MAARIISDTPTGDLDIKRMYLPGVKVEDDCPKCGKTWTFDGDVSHISYPVMNDKVELYGNCECGEDWSVSVTLGVKIKL